MTPFKLFPKGYGPANRDVQIVTQSGRVAHPPLVDIQREDDDILHQLCTTQACISIWSLLASSNTRREVLVKALNQIRVDTTTTLKGLIHILTADRATCIVFSDDELPLEGSDHVLPLYIDVAWSSRLVPPVMLDNGSTLNAYPLVTTIALEFSPVDFGPST